MINKDKINKVFVYGTLKKGYHNHIRLLSTSTFLGDFLTSPKYNMISLGGFPGVLKYGKTSILGEVYEVDDGTFYQLDCLEGYPRMYTRDKIKTTYGKAWMYIYNTSRQYTTKEFIKSGVWE